MSRIGRVGYDACAFAAVSVAPGSTSASSNPSHFVIAL
jgi:hypothetical protein